MLVFVVAAGATGLRREQREKLTAMDENPITITVTQGSTAVLPCSVDPRYTEQHKDTYKVVWVNPLSTALSIEDRRIINDMRISVERPFLRDWNLHIRNVSITDAGEYKCQLNTDPVKSKKVNLLVNVPPMITEYTQPVEITRIEGDLVELFCNASGVPSPVVSWYRMNRWAPAEKERVGTNGAQLVIHNVTRMCADRYICIADNSVPPATKQEFLVEVNYSPEIRLPNYRIGQQLGKETILECIISSSPRSIMQWRKEETTFGNGLTNDNRHEVSVYESNTKEPNAMTLNLRIVSVKPEDFGIYTCEASNRFGKVVRDMELHEFVPRPPPTTATTTTTTASTPAPDPWGLQPSQQQGSNNVHRHGTGSRHKKPGQAGNYHGGDPDVSIDHPQNPNWNGVAGSDNGGGHYGPYSQRGSGGGGADNDLPGQERAGGVYDQEESGSSCVMWHSMLGLLCLTSSLSVMVQRNM